MGKIIGSWSGMRNYLEKEMLAESLRGRVRYGCTSYTGMDRIVSESALVRMFTVLDRRLGKNA